MSNAPAVRQVVQATIDDLRPDPANPRRISDAQLEALTKSLREYGFVQPVLARREDKTVIGGHQRLTAARRLGYKTVPVIFLDIALFSRSELPTLDFMDLDAELRRARGAGPQPGVDLPGVYTYEIEGKRYAYGCPHCLRPLYFDGRIERCVNESCPSKLQAPGPDDQPQTT